MSAEDEDFEPGEDSDSDRTVHTESADSSSDADDDDDDESEDDEEGQGGGGIARGRGGGVLAALLSAGSPPMSPRGRAKKKGRQGGSAGRYYSFSMHSPSLEILAHAAAPCRKRRAVPHPKSCPADSELSQGMSG